MRDIDLLAHDRLIRCAQSIIHRNYNISVRSHALYRQPKRDSESVFAWYSAHLIDVESAFSASHNFQLTVEWTNQSDVAVITRWLSDFVDARQKYFAWIHWQPQKTRGCFFKTFLHLGLMMSYSIRAAAVALILSSVSLIAVAAPSPVDYPASTIIATAKQMNVPMDGKFKKFSAQIDYDATKPSAGTASLTIQMGSFDLGDASYNDQTQNKEWFDAKTFPVATFTSSAIAAGGNNLLNVTGTLTIKGKSEKITVPVKVTALGKQTVFDGALPIKRSAFDIGTGEWKDTSIVADDVTIKFHIVEGSK